MIFQQCEYDTYAAGDTPWLSTISRTRSIFQRREGGGGSKSQRSLPSKLRPFDAHEPTMVLATKREKYGHFYITITVDGLAAIQLESLHFSTLNLAEKSVIR